MILKVIAFTSCVIAVAYPIVVARNYIGTNELGRAQMFALLGEAVIMCFTTVFAILALSDLLILIPEWVQSSMRILMCMVAIYTSHRMHSVLSKILGEKDD